MLSLGALRRIAQFREDFSSALSARASGKVELGYGLPRCAF
jgi:hypothetical protein